MVKKVILAILGLSFALLVCSCEDKPKQKKKRFTPLVTHSEIAIVSPEKEQRHHEKW